MKPENEAVCIACAGTECGEGPVWSADEQVLYWVDITGARLHCYDPRRCCDTAWDMPGEVGALALRRGGGLVLMLQSGFAFFDVGTSSIEHLFDPHPEDTETHLNDAKVDSRGRLWAGTYHTPMPRQPRGVLFRLDPDLSCRRMDEGFHVPNGPDWSPDDRVMYLSDSIAQVIYAYDFDVDTGTIENRRVFARVPPELGRPDGLTVDAEGYIWSGRADGWRLSRYAPDGRIDRVVTLPVQVVTNCAFGGDDLATLYITTARWGVPSHALADQPLAGGLLAMCPGVRGRLETQFPG